MILKRYPNTKMSGIEWLGEIPEHWDLLAIKRITSIPITDGPHETPELLDDGIPFISAEAIKNDQIDFSKKRGFISAAEHKRFSKKYKPKKGDVYMVKSGATTGNIAFVDTDEEFNIWSPLAVIRPDHKKAITSFVFFFMKSRNFFQSIELSWSYGTQQNIGMNVIGNLPIVIPQLSEQCAITSFLDRETTRIDTLISKKERQIALLQEKRSALISRVVTKGLDPNVKMKDSGIEWMGEIPAHWMVKRIKQIGAIRYGLGEPPEYVDDGLPFIRATDISHGKINLDAVKKVRPVDVPWSRRPSLRLHEILVVRSGAYTGDSALVLKDVVGCIAGYDMVLTVNRAHAPFVALVFLSKYMLQGQIYLERLRAAQPHLNAEELGQFVIMMPPLSEQKAITDFLNYETVKIDLMMKKVSDSIDLLREYRTALISAAVTGKIDVRNAA